MSAVTTPAISYEWRRIRSTKSLPWLLGIIVASAVAGGAQALATDGPGSLGSGAAAHVGQVGIIAAALGALAIGTEFRWGTIRQLFISFPRRAAILTAKLAVVAGLVAGASIVSSMIGGVFALARDPGDSALDWAGFALRGALVLVGWVIIGFALAGLFKSTIVGVAVPLVFAFLVETALIQITQSETLAFVLPFANAAQSVAPGVPAAEAWEHLAVFGAYVLVLLGISLTVLNRRDA